MARSRSSSGRRLNQRLRKKAKKNNSTIKSLPTELVTEVLARLASSSFDGLFNAKLSWKIFNEAADYNCVYKKVSLQKFPIIPWQPSRQLSSFLNKCKESENPEALFRQGVIDFFTLGQHREGLESLQKAANAGHGEAVYVLGIILLLSGDKYMAKGIELLRGMREAKEAGRRLKEYRENLRNIMTNIWIRSPIIKKVRQPCCAMQDEHKWRFVGWESNIDEISCEACRCDREVDFVTEMFPRG